ncbi:E3 ubiquitin-protein ligase RHA2B-like [Malania oleifera]|uniref:E3 ubiquitin-protein ligase RHA2B-like n=1 Tax=Malania oleifera TaxID=397392 RepID=UPI0025ADDE8A|nr:E3 ubiquitin-protein ligase RHA2B-like [Malania oleifera]
MPKYSATVAMFLLKLLRHLKIIFMAVLTHLGMLNFHPRPSSPLTGNTNDDEGVYDPTNSVLVMDWPCPLPVPIPLYILKASIKNRLPVMEYADFLMINRSSSSSSSSPSSGVIISSQDSDQELNTRVVCAVCLDSVERKHEIRELPNCFHVFHRECLDSWVDEDGVTCPVCRSMLFPPFRGVKGVLIYQYHGYDV